MDILDAEKKHRLSCQRSKNMAGVSRGGFGSLRRDDNNVRGMRGETGITVACRMARRGNHNGDHDADMVDRDILAGGARSGRVSAPSAENCNL